MPFVPLTSVHPDVQLGGWRIAEAEADLLPMALFHPEEHARLGTVNHPVKRLEYLASRAALRTISPESQFIALQKGNKGQPFLTESHFLSLSHTAEWAAAAVSARQAVAIDTENLNRIISPRMHHLFLNPEEREWVEVSPQAALLVWCIKETLYKLFSPDNEEVSFARELVVPVPKLVLPSEEQHVEIVATFNREGQIHPVEIVLSAHSGYLLAYGVASKP